MRAMNVIMNKRGEKLTKPEDIMNRWRKHFGEVLNRPDPSIQFEEHNEEMEDIQINVEVPDKSEIKKAIKTLKNKKAAGIDGIKGEMLKESGEIAVEALNKLFMKIWNREEIPNDWNEGMIVTVPKKGDMKDCNNWKGITLL